MEQQTEIFVPKHIAMELKSKGFNEMCVGFYTDWHTNDSAEPIVDGSFDLNEDWESDDYCSAPTYDQVVGWFAEKKIEIFIGRKSYGWEYEIVLNDDDELPAKIVNYPSRQQSLLTAFEEALKLI
jgi:hypothetical protein